MYFPLNLKMICSFLLVFLVGSQLCFSQNVTRVSANISQSNAFPFIFGNDGLNLVQYNSPLDIFVPIMLMKGPGTLMSLL